jgi:uncharacterized zinc-type alcohol dehydrogenase-like protein
MKIQGFAAQTKGAELTPFSYEAKPVGPDDVFIKISHCGICHSDCHLIHDDWGLSRYPLLPGHEIIGEVKEVGAHVKHVRVGQRVGVGWQRSACLTCAECLRGEENLCAKQQATCVGNFGGFADGIVTDSRFVFAIPDGIKSAEAAPLLCGGITVFSPLKHHRISARDRVGIVGIGGLGHMAVQFAAGFGCEVTAFSSSADKEAEAKKLGASRFVNSKDAGALKGAARSLDFILSTVNADLDWMAYLSCLRPNGTLCLVGVPPTPVSVPAFVLVASRLSISGSPIGGRFDMHEMLEMAARSKIGAQVETTPLANVNQALKKVLANSARYRMVLTV